MSYEFIDINILQLLLFIVINELEGLSRGAKLKEQNLIAAQPQVHQGSINTVDNKHAAMVVAMSKNALEFINSKNQTMK